MQKKISTLLFLIFSTFTVSLAQQFPLYTQYMFDPYVINPSMVAFSGRSEANLNYRQQWTGFKDGPKTVQFDYQHPFDKRMAIGLNVYDDRTVLISNTSAMATFGYKVPITPEHIIGFGLSAGFFANRLRLEDVAAADLGDPALKNAQNNFSFDGQFGFNYSWRSNLVIGASLLRLTDTKNFSTDKFQTLRFGELKNKIFFATYRFAVSSTLDFTPNLLYRVTSDNLNYFEGSGILSYKGVLALGAGYRQNFGPTLIARVTYRDLSAGFGYDFPSNKAQVSTGGTNEIQLKVRFGRTVEKFPARQKLITDDQPTEEVPVVADKPAAQEPVVVAEEKPVEKTITPPVEQKSAPAEPVVQPEPVKEPVKDAFADAPPKEAHYYMIAGAFASKSNANKLIRELEKKGIKAEIKTIPGSDYYYVHIPKFMTNDITLDKIMQIRNDPTFKEAWYKKMD